MNEIVKDPVCHMEVPATSFATEYAGIHYSFCSAQCKERFLASPHLYVGFPGNPAPAQEGKEVIKRHRLLLSAPLDAIQAEQVKQALIEMMGIHEVYIEADGWIVSNWRLSIIWKKSRLAAFRWMTEYITR